MTTQLHRKTHPMVLTAAAAVTIFSVLGSAAITGLIPSAHSSRQEIAPTANESSNKTADQESPIRRQENEPRLAGAAAPRQHGAFDAQRPILRQSAMPRDNVAICKSCGVIESVRIIEHEGEGSGLGAVAGGVAGGVVGNQIGNGKGNTLMTILGIGGGAYAGHTIEKRMNASNSYLVKVRMEDGSYRSVTQHSKPEFTVGDHVRVANGSLTSA